jgi:hypothetical protein
MTEEQFAEAEEELEELRHDVREAIAEEIGGEPEDYRADKRVADGGE